MTVAPEIDIPQEPRYRRGEVFGGMAVVGAGVELGPPSRDELAEYIAKVVRSAADPEG